MKTDIIINFEKNEQGLISETNLKEMLQILKGYWKNEGQYFNANMLIPISALQIKIKNTIPTMMGLGLRENSETISSLFSELYLFIITQASNDKTKTQEIYLNIGKNIPWDKYISLEGNQFVIFLRNLLELLMNTNPPVEKSSFFSTSRKKIEPPLSILGAEIKTYLTEISLTYIFNKLSKDDVLAKTTDFIKRTLSIFTDFLMKGFIVGDLTFIRKFLKQNFHVTKNIGACRFLDFKPIVIGFEGFLVAKDKKYERLEELFTHLLTEIDRFISQKNNGHVQQMNDELRTLFFTIYDEPTEDFDPLRQMITINNILMRYRGELEKHPTKENLELIARLLRFTEGDYATIVSGKNGPLLPVKHTLKNFEEPFDPEDYQAPKIDDNDSGVYIFKL